MNNQAHNSSMIPELGEKALRRTSCEDESGHCITCADEAREVCVLSVDQEIGTAIVRVDDITEEIDITLVENVAAGDQLLIHGGVAIAHL
jgi:HupF/HypC family